MLDPKAQAAFADRMGFLGTVDNAAVAPEDLKKPRSASQKREMAAFRTMNFDYLAKNTEPVARFLEQGIQGLREVGG